MQNILKIENLKKYYGTKNNITKAIDNISFSVNKGEFVAIMGASGSGKTTLLNCISTIDTVTTSLNNLLNPALSSEYSYLYAILYSLSLFLFIYLIYFVATYFGYKKNIEE